MERNTATLSPSLSQDMRDEQRSFTLSLHWPQLICVNTSTEGDGFTTVLSVAHSNPALSDTPPRWSETQILIEREREEKTYIKNFKKHDDT